MILKQKGGMLKSNKLSRSYFWRAMTEKSNFHSDESIDNSQLKFGEKLVRCDFLVSS
jgi:hypothetical protein